MRRNSEEYPAGRGISAANSSEWNISVELLYNEERDSVTTKNAPTAGSVPWKASAAGRQLGSHLRRWKRAKGVTPCRNMTPCRNKSEGVTPILRTWTFARESYLRMARYPKVGGQGSGWGVEWGPMGSHLRIGAIAEGLTPHEGRPHM